MSLEGECMKKVLKSYKKTIILLVMVILGVICGLIFKEKMNILKPLGDLFLNLLLVSIVPMLFFTLSSSIANTKNTKRLKKIIKISLLLFLVYSVIGVIMSFLVLVKIPLISGGDIPLVKELFASTETINEMSFLERLVTTISTNDFVNLLSTKNLVALMIVSLLFGLATLKSGESGKAIREFLNSGTSVIYKFIEIISYYAPIGLFAYMASLVGSLGSVILAGFLKTTILYFIVSIMFMVIVYSVFAVIAGGIKGLKTFWREVIPAMLTSLATCSSAASVPINMSCAKKMGVPSDVSEVTISLGTSFHKDGSAIGSVFKIMFLVSLFGISLSTGLAFKVLFVSVLATLLVSAVPIGGGTISEMLILNLMGMPVEALPILTVIATVIDAPATVLNVIGDTSVSMVIAKVIQKNK